MTRQKASVEDFMTLFGPRLRGVIENASNAPLTDQGRAELLARMTGAMLHATCEAFRVAWPDHECQDTDEIAEELCRRLPKILKDTPRPTVTKR